MEMLVTDLIKCLLSHVYSVFDAGFIKFCNCGNLSYLSPSIGSFEQQAYFIFKMLITPESPYLFI